MSSDNLTASTRFLNERADEIDRQGRDVELKRLTNDWFIASTKTKYSYHFEWLGRPIIQYPQDMVAMQEILWRVQPDLVIETGIAHGGSLIYYASILELIGKGRVLGIDIDIRSHNRQAIEAHPMFKRIDLMEGSSISPDVVARVSDIAKGKTVLVVLDSNHTEDHVLQELKCYAPLVSVGSYCVVMDTVIEDMDANAFPDRAWSRGDNPKTAVWKFLKDNAGFAIDEAIDSKILISVAPSGYLKRLR